MSLAEYPDVVFNAPTEKSAGANRKYNRSVTLCAVPEVRFIMPNLQRPLIYALRRRPLPSRGIRSIWATTKLRRVL